VLNDLTDHVEQEVAMLGRVQGPVSSPQAGDRVNDCGEVARAQGGGVGPAGSHQRRRGGAAGPQRLTYPLQVGAGSPGPLLDHLTQPGNLDGGEVDHSLGGRPATRAVGLQVE